MLYFVSMLRFAAASFETTICDGHYPYCPIPSLVPELVGANPVNDTTKCFPVVGDFRDWHELYTIRWPITRTKQCNKIYATHDLAEAECHLPPTCGEPVRVQLDVNWWGKRHDMCVGLGADVSHDLLGNPYLTRHGKPIRQAKVYTIAEKYGQVGMTHCKPWYEHMYVAIADQQYYLLHKDAICNVPAVVTGRVLQHAHYGNITVPHHCVMEYKTRLSPYHNTPDSLALLPNRSSHFQLPMWRCVSNSQPDYAATPFSSPPIITGGHTVMMGQPLDGCMIREWGTNTFAMTKTPSPHSYATSITIPGLSIAKEILMYLLDVTLYAASWVTHAAWEALTDLNAEYRISEIAIAATVAYWCLNVTQGTLITLIYITAFGLVRQSSTG